MKKVFGAIIVIVLVWIFGVELLLKNTTSLTEKAKTIPAMQTIETISKLVVLDSIEKTGLQDRYNYDQQSLQTLLNQNNVRIPDKNYTYIYCAGGQSNTTPNANMITAALHKTETNVIAEGTSLFLESVPTLESLKPENRNAQMMASILNITPSQGECFEIQ